MNKSSRRAATVLVAPRGEPGPAVASPGRPGLPGPVDPWATVRKLGRRQLRRLLALEPKVLRGDAPEAIHDLRVVSRRLAAALGLLYPPPRAREMRKARRRLRRARQTLSEARNCDVLLERAATVLGRRQVARRAAWEAVRDHLTKRRTAAFDKAIRQLAALNLPELYLRFQPWLAVPPAPSEAPNHADRATAPAESTEAAGAPLDFAERSRRKLQKTWQIFEDRLAAAERDSEPAVVHRARIATKRLRYLVEMLAKVGAPGSSEALAWLRRLQRLLGEWYDLEVFDEIVLEWLARPRFLRDQLELALQIQKLVLSNRATQKRLTARYRELGSGSEGYVQLRALVTSEPPPSSTAPFTVRERPAGA